MIIHLRFWPWDVPTCCCLSAYGLRQERRRRDCQPSLPGPAWAPPHPPPPTPALRQQIRKFKFPAQWCPFWQCGNTDPLLVRLYLNLMLSWPMSKLVLLSLTNSYTIELPASLITIHKNMFFFSFNKQKALVRQCQLNSEVTSTASTEWPQLLTFI